MFRGALMGLHPTLSRLNPNLSSFMFMTCLFVSRQLRLSRRLHQMRYAAVKMALLFTAWSLGAGGSRGCTESTTDLESLDAVLLS